ncbi:hypothetical protein PIB30_061624 [Stylosanthes scabra]|uniref:Uncharacterized protein n=1 Tax=Stylosanthes scabra TaxID=79078 RepID=A0ABU6QL98_9FABA|nr:hypothetical protein [Stylosanthes scabra]
MEVDTIDALLAQSKAISQQLNTLNKKIEKLEVASLGTQGEIQATCCLCGVLMKITIVASLEKINKLSKLTTWETSKGSSLTMILIPTPTIPDGETTLTLVGEESRIKETITSKTLTLTTTDFVQTTNNFIEEARAHFRNQESAIRNLETQVGEIAKQLSTTLPNAFPSDTEVNPKGECKAITLRNRKALQERKQEELNKEVVKSTPTKLTMENQDSRKQQHTLANNKENHIPFLQ